MTTKEYAKLEGITPEAALYRARRNGVARKVKSSMSPVGYVWDFKSSNGHSESTTAQAESLLRVAEAFPEVNVIQAISIARILDGKEAK